MSFFSGYFLLFLAGALFLYYVMPKKIRWLVLLAVNLCFYLFGGVRGLAYLLFTAATTYGTGLLLERLNARAKADKNAKVKGKKQLILTLCLVVNFGLLYVLKYWNFTAETLGKVGVSLPMSSLLMPLGLSFYMFQSVGYTVDCYRGKYPAQKNPLKYLLFVSFFPQMVQGPISRYDQLAPQLIEPHAWKADNIKYGIQLVIWGYMKKLLIADRAAVVVSAVFGQTERYGGAVYAFAVLFYCIQLYCDFSGGIDITRGVAQMFGVDLAENFRRPIFATSLADYWRRWHITLGTWMRDYVFYPLAFSKPLAALSRKTRARFGGKLGKVIPTACATFVVYLIIGIWHGANFRYIFFGFYNGAIMTASILMAANFSKWKKKLKINDKQPLFHAFQLLRTMILVFIGRYITRAPRLMVAFSMLKTTVLGPRFAQLTNGTLGKFGLTLIDYGVVALGVILMLILEGRQEKGVKIRESLEYRPAVVQWLAIFLPLLAFLLHIVFRGSAVDVTLIYQQF